MAAKKRTMHLGNALGLLLFGVPCLTLSGSPPPASSSGIQHFGDAHGSTATVGSTVRAGKSFPVYLGSCGTLRPPVTKSNTGATVDVAPFLRTGTVDTTASATDVSGTSATRTSATVQSVNLLSGLVTAREVRAVSTVSHDLAGFHTSGGGSTLTNLVVAGVPILVAPGPNTRIELAGFGHVILNEHIANLRANSASLAVNMIHVVVTLPNPLVPVGTNIVVAHARSRLARTNISGTLGGFAYGTTAMVSREIVSGLSALVLMGCQGTNGAVRTNSVVTASHLPPFSTGVVVNTASGLVDATSATGETTSTVEALDLLSSIVTADVIKADAHAFTDGRRFTFTDTGSMFVNLSVAGFPEIDDGVAPNTRLSLPGLGTLWLKREIFRPNSIEVRMIELVVNQENALGLPIGTNVRVAVANASAH